VTDGVVVPLATADMVVRMVGMTTECWNPAKVFFFFFPSLLNS
jgi:hypothetical protein